MADENSQFSFRVAERPEEMAIAIAGTIDEASAMKPPDARGRRVIIDASGVQRINSLGVRAWVDLMEELGRQTYDIVLVKLPAVLVTQASMITSFLGNARVHSFTTPWICLKCNHATEQMHGIADPVPETLRCANCGSTMELDWDRESYLAFRGG
jgi:anti-anti-sigma regulatory factor